MSPQARRQALGITALALALGSAAGWAVSGRFAVLRASVMVAAWFGAQILATTRGGVLARGLVVLAVPAGWVAGAMVWDWALVVCTAAAGIVGFAVQCANRAGSSVRAETRGGRGSAPFDHRRSGWIGAAYGLALVAAALGLVPVWVLLVLLSVPWAVRAGVDCSDDAWGDWSLAFNGQLLLAFLIRGIVR